MKRFAYYTVVPKLPEQLSPLYEIANNLWWCWQPDAVDLFRRISPEDFSTFEHNPIRLIGSLSQERLRELIRDDGFMAHMRSVHEELKRYLSIDAWYTRLSKDWKHFTIAYFSAEYGIHESLPIYSGGLGVLSGDHLKSASDLGIPLVGVGLLYRHGYFRQSLNSDGWQHERYPENDFHNMALTLMRDDSGNPHKPYIDYPFGRIYFQIWRVNVGRVALYLLDTNLNENPIEGRDITKQLYGGDNEMRLKQEILLGIGGMRALRVLGISPTVCHMNEGHSGFMPLERVRQLMHDRGISFDVAFEAVYGSNIFTTHTPVPAGNDRFSPELVLKYFTQMIHELGISQERFLDFGREVAGNRNEQFCMTVIAIRFAGFKNGVSALHGQVSRQMWKNIWPYLPDNEVPIGHVTNGIHILSWLAKDMRELLGRYLGERWVEAPDNRDLWKRVKRIPDPELWHVRESLRRQLVVYTRRRLRESMEKRGMSKSELAVADEVLDPSALTIGFARRFATYKRGNLLFRDIPRLKKILMDADRPVQFIFAGKAHPRDDGGKNIIKDIVHIIRDADFRHKIVFLEDYDISLARKLVAGVDLWLNNPRRPLEACGTSGMKVTPNGGLNMSILDGWWEEGYNSEVGWAIGVPEIYDDPEYQDEVESNAIYTLLEKEILPTFYDRSADGIPRRWIQFIKEAMTQLLPVFNTNHMVENYTNHFYLNASINWNQCEYDDFAHARMVADWHQRVLRDWHQVSVADVKVEHAHDTLGVGESAKITAEVVLGSLMPTDIIVEVYYGKVEYSGNIIRGKSEWLSNVEPLGDGRYRFTGTLSCDRSGRFGCTVRVLNNSPLDIRRLDVTPLVWW